MVVTVNNTSMKAMPGDIAGIRNKCTRNRVRKRQDNVHPDGLRRAEEAEKRLEKGSMQAAADLQG